MVAISGRRTGIHIAWKCSGGGFFNHFRNENELARALLQRYMEREDAVFDDVFARGRKLADDPLQAFLVGLKLLAELMGELPGGHLGCLVAHYCYQERLFDAEIRALNRRIVLLWRARFRRILDEISTRSMSRTKRSTPTRSPTRSLGRSRAA